MKSLIVLWLFLILCVANAVAQNEISIKGKVIDTSGTPIGGVSVTLSSRIGTITNDKGEFTISGPTTSKILHVSYIGYISLNIHFDQHIDSAITIVLKPEKAELSDVVVIGVQQQNQRTTISSISGITSKDIENRPVPSVDVLLQGRVAGVNVQVASGEPGVAPTVSIRGNSKINTQLGSNPNVQQAQSISGPLYVIDGIPIDPNDLSSNTIDATGTNFLAGININDIENVQVQKDATAAAAWGSRGANGVIYITTKKGKSVVPLFDVNVYYGVEQKSKLLPTVTGSAERKLKMNILEQYYSIDTLQQMGIPQMLTDSLNPYFNNATDWQGPFYKTGNIKNVDASMSAATENVNYRVSMNYYNEQGAIRLTGFQRYSLRGNFNFKINPKLSSQLVIGLVKSNRQRGMKYNNSDQNTPFDGSNQPSSFYPLNGFDSSNYLGYASKLRNINNDDNYSAALTTNYDILPGLRYSLQGSANVHIQSRDYFQPSNLDAVAVQLAQASGDISTQPSYAEADRSTYSTYLVTNTLNFTKTFNNNSNNAHHLNFTVSQQYSSNVSNIVELNANNTPTNDIKTITGVTPTDVLVGPNDSRSDYGRDAMLSFMGQLQYDFKGRYLLYASDRADASSRFGSDNKWGYFPAAGIGWIASDENFMKGVKNVVSFLKFRFSYGITGQQAGGFYAPFNSYQVSGTYNGNIALQPNYQNGLTKNNLTWSKQYMKDLGMDITLFNNRINLTADVYDKLTKNDFFNFTLPFYTGYSTVYFNAKDLWVSNKGFDLTLNTNNLSPSSPVTWHSTFILSFNKNIIAKLPNNNQTFYQTDYNGFDRIYRVGLPINEFFQMQYQGVYNQQSQIPFNPLTGKVISYFKTYFPVQAGYPNWKDQNGDYDVWSDEDNGDNHGDLVPTGNPNPLFTGGFTNDFTYKNFTLSISSVFTWKRTVVNSFAQSQFDNAFGNGINGFERARLPDLSGLNYWTPTKAQDPNYKADFPSINPLAPYYYEFFTFSNMWNVDGSYFKIKFANLSYMLPSKISDKLKLKSINVYGMMTNILTLKNKHNTMPDPEAVDQTGVYTGGLYPQSKVYTLGIDVRF